MTLSGTDLEREFADFQRQQTATGGLNGEELRAEFDAEQQYLGIQEAEAAGFRFTEPIPILQESNQVIPRMEAYKPKGAGELLQMAGAAPEPLRMQEVAKAIPRTAIQFPGKLLEARSAYERTLADYVSRITKRKVEPIGAEQDYTYGKAIRDFARKTFPKEQENFPVELAEFSTEMGLQLPLGPVGFALTAGFSGAGDAYETALEMGWPEEDARNAATLSGALGTSTLLAVGPTMARALGAMQKGAANRVAASVIKDFISPPLVGSGITYVQASGEDFFNRRLHEPTEDIGESARKALTDPNVIAASIQAGPMFLAFHGLTIGTIIGAQSLARAKPERARTIAAKDVPTREEVRDIPGMERSRPEERRALAILLRNLHGVMAGKTAPTTEGGEPRAGEVPPIQAPVPGERPAGERGREEGGQTIQPGAETGRETGRPPLPQEERPEVPPEVEVRPEAEPRTVPELEAEAREPVEHTVRFTEAERKPPDIGKGQKKTITIPVKTKEGKEGEKDTWEDFPAKGTLYADGNLAIVKEHRVIEPGEEGFPEGTRHTDRGTKGYAVLHLPSGKYAGRELSLGDAKRMVGIMVDSGLDWSKTLDELPKEPINDLLGKLKPIRLGYRMREEKLPQDFEFKALPFLKTFVREVPEFALDPTFTFDGESLVFRDNFQYRLKPELFGLNAADLKKGDKIKIDLKSAAIRQPTEKEIREATREAPPPGRRPAPPPPPEQPKPPAPETAPKLQGKALTTEYKTVFNDLTDQQRYDIASDLGYGIDAENGKLYITDRDNKKHFLTRDQLADARREFIDRGKQVLAEKAPEEPEVESKARPVPVDPRLQYDTKGASASILLDQLEDGRWASGYEYAHRRGSMDGGQHPPWTRMGPGWQGPRETYATRQEAINAAAKQIIDANSRIRAGGGSVTTQMQEFQAQRIVKWARALIKKPKPEKAPEEPKPPAPEVAETEEIKIERKKSHAKITLVKYRDGRWSYAVDIGHDQGSRYGMQSPALPEFWFPDRQAARDHALKLIIGHNDQVVAATDSATTDAQRKEAQSIIDWAEALLGTPKPLPRRGRKPKSQGAEYFAAPPQPAEEARRKPPRPTAQGPAIPEGAAVWMPPQEQRPGRATLGRREMPIQPMPNPEVVRFVRETLGKYPGVARGARRWLGRFYHPPDVPKDVAGYPVDRTKAGIEITQQTAKNQAQMAAVLDHEVGHMIDWIPEGAMQRGNILGRIASLKGYRKKVLPAKPGAEKLTDADRARLRREAKKLAEEGAEEVIDEEIVRTIGLKPQDILDIWRGLTENISPEMYDYIARLDTRQKKAIILQAMRGQIPAELQRFARILREKTGRQIRRPKPGYDVRAETVAIYKRLLREEIRKRMAYDLETIRNELIDVSKWWRGDFDPKRDKYRASGTELYADAISVLLKSPGDLQVRAPNFWKGFFAWLDNKPEVRDAFLQFQDLVNGTPEKLAERWSSDARDMFLRSEDVARAQHQEAQKKRESLTSIFASYLVDKGYPVLRVGSKLARKGGPKERALQEAAKYALGEMDMSGSEVKTFMDRVGREVSTPLRDNGMSHEDVGEYLMARRIMQERIGVANPLGHIGGKMGRFQNPRQVDEVLRNFKEDLENAGFTPEAVAERVDEVKHFVRGIEDPTAEITGDKLAEYLNLREDQSGLGSWERAAVLDRLREFFRWAKDNDVLEIDPMPQTAQMLLDNLERTLGKTRFSMLEAAAQRFDDLVFPYVEQAKDLGVYNREIFNKRLKGNRHSYATFAVTDHISTKIPAGIYEQIGTFKEIGNPYLSTVGKIQSLIHLSAITEAKTATLNLLREIPDGIGKRKAINRYSAAGKPPRGKEWLWQVEDGKWAVYAVDPYIARTFSKLGSVEARRLVQFMSAATYKAFHPLYVTLSLGWQAMNPPRDFKRTYQGLAAAHGGKASWRQMIEGIMDLYRLPKAYLGAMPAAARRASGKYDPLIEQMLSDKSMGESFASYFYGQAGKRTTFETNLQRAGITPQDARSLASRALSALAHPVQWFTVFQETLPHVAAYKVLTDLGIDGRRRAYQVRQYSGTPNTYNKGLATEYTNPVLMYSNVMIQGYRANAEVALNPKTAAGYWFRSFLMDYIPKAGMAAAAGGVFGPFVKRMMDNISSYDKEKYTCIPLGLTEAESGQEKTVYLRIPHEDTNRLFAAMAWHFLSGTNRFDVLSELQVIYGELPSVAPPISIASRWATYASGSNPVDPWRGREIIPPDEFRVGGTAALKPMMTWTLDQTGVLSDFLTWSGTLAGVTEEPKRDLTTWERTVGRFPGLSRVIKVSDRGMTEGQWNEVREIERQGALVRLSLPEEFRRNTKERYLLNRLHANAPETMTDTQIERWRELNRWYRTIYLPEMRRRQREAASQPR